MAANDSLQHHGVLGMKWGIRRYQPYTGGKKGIFLNKKKKLPTVEKAKKTEAKQAVKDAGKALAKYSNSVGLDKATRAKLYSDYERAQKKANALTAKTKKQHIRKKEKTNSTKGMSDAELRRRINRLQMEKQYKQLTAREKSKGEKLVGDILINAAKQTATNYISKAMTKGIDEMINKLSTAG